MATAFHEAGHAVVATALGRVVHRISIEPKQRYLGRCEFGPGRRQPTDDWRSDEILIALAGMVAEAQQTG
ncbi:MAG: M50 family metallopeptidase, partial [Gemmataceae bacterium]